MSWQRSVRRSGTSLTTPTPWPPATTSPAPTGRERLTRMYEQTGGTFVLLIEMVLDRLELSPEQMRRVPGLITAELEAITGREIEAGP
jgi:hypothetical protein